jgi:hypothetical protein
MTAQVPQPTTPPATPRSSQKLEWLGTKDDDEIDDTHNPILTEYELLNAQLRRRIQDYEIALLKMQLRDRDRELQAMLHARQHRCTENKVTELVLRIARQEEQMEMLSAQVTVWKGHALEARDMLERTYRDLDRVPCGAD